MTRKLPALLHYGLLGNAVTVDLGLAVLRLITGLAFVTVFEKVLPRAGVWGPQPWFVEDVAAMGFPLPLFFAWAAVLAEFVGGFLLMLGLATRPAAFFTAIVTGMAAFLYHDGDIGQSGLTATVFLTMSMTLLLAGPGRFSLDGFFASRRAKRSLRTFTLKDN